jgi:hypothetical protein
MRALARIPTNRVRHARDVLSAIAEALHDDRGRAPLRRRSTPASSKTVRDNHGEAGGRREESRPRSA